MSGKKHRSGWEQCAIVSMVLIISIAVCPFTVQSQPIEPAMQDEVLSATNSVVATPTPRAIPDEVKNLLEKYKRACESKDMAGFESCFWDPGKQRSNFKIITEQWHDIRIKYLQLGLLPTSTSDNLSINVKWQLRFEDRAKRPMQLTPVVQIDFERRSKEWKINKIVVSRKPG